MNNPVLYVKSPPVHHLPKAARVKDTLVNENLERQDDVIDLMEKRLAYFTTDFNRRAYGDITLVMQNEERISGKVLGIEPGAVQFESGETQLTLDSADILEIEWLGKPFPLRVGNN
ncbi:hypothetical protein [Paenisporosarcina cavernae]|uniref:Uncharacterized protein n=1 Tax=Paenisporosarcina cavernae TaxID=2320858 RepID=A0A385YRK8_9BACL|nr:hypothetical protein [Paenisporosarcina cavernae]AYC29030.1 hypothetical protein D3873_03755 [Paenisporosarcina cavernae]